MGATLGAIMGHDQFHGIDGRSYAEAAAGFIRMGFNRFDADIEDARRRLGAMVTADLAQNVQLTLTEFFDA
jgi:hypothetical protein